MVFFTGLNIRRPGIYLAENIFTRINAFILFCASLIVVNEIIHERHAHAQ